MKKVIDVSIPVHNKMPFWPGGKGVRLSQLRKIGPKSLYNNCHLSCDVHTGTHIDAPRHYIKDGQKTNNMPLDQMIGTARVIEIQDSKKVTPEELKGQAIRRGERILFKTRNSLRPWYKRDFDEDFVSICKEAADFLAQKAPRVIGIDYLSVGGFKDDGDYIHRSLLSRGIWLIEGLDLSQVSGGKYLLYCLPIKLEAGDGAPARAILRPL